MGPIHENLTVAKFTKPDGVYFAKINTTDGGTSSYGVSAAFIDGTSPSRASSYQVTQPQQNDVEEDESTPDNSGDGGNTPPEEETPSEDQDTTPPEDNTNNDNNTGGNIGNETIEDNNNNANDSTVDNITDTINTPED